jgi:HEAT repeat protein
MIELEEPLSSELSASCAHTVYAILKRRSESDFEQLRQVVQAYEVDERVRQSSIMLLGRWGRPEAAPDIIALLPALDERGLINAVDALGRLASPEAIEAVMELSYHPSPDVRRFAVYALERAETPETMIRLSEMAQNDEADFVRHRAQNIVENQNDNKGGYGHEFGG